MARITLGDKQIAYELLGEAGNPAVVITPGGRFARWIPGVRELGSALADGGYRVLLWDRPNCGESDMCFTGDSESEMQAAALVELVRALDLGPIAILGGSAGSRCSLIAASLAPELVSKLALWWISGGPISLAQLAAYYYGGSAMAASASGMKAVAALPEWQEALEANPRNAEILATQDPGIFIEQMQRWTRAFAYSDDSPVPGMDRADFARLTMPALIYRSGKSDLSHTRRTSKWVHELLPHATIMEPPWGDQEWNERMAAQFEKGESLFLHWPRLAPGLLDFLRR